MADLVSLEKGQYSGKVRDIEFYNGITLGSTVYDPYGDKSGLHFHSNPHISLLVEGFHVEKRKGIECFRKPGDVLYCNAGEEHQFTTTKSSRNVNIELDSQFLRNFEVSENIIEASLKNDLDTRLKILKIFYEYSMKDEFSETSIQLLLLDLVSSSKKAASNQKPLWIIRLQNIMNDRWNELLTLNELSVLLDVHPVTISKYFAKFFSCSFGEYRRKLRIYKSVQLIKNTSLSITEIAFECGFADQSHFIRNFKKLTGFTPKAYQKW
ncbi:MAG: helix-turn-helix domain-containing protein [Maribacter sp.]